jgi:hypothetical protein
MWEEDCKKLGKCIGYCQKRTRRARDNSSASSQHYECYHVATKRHSAALSDAGLDSSARPCCRGGHMPGGYGKSAMPDRPLSGKVAIIAGGAKNLGGLISRTLAAEGASIVVHYHASAASSAGLSEA